MDMSSRCHHGYKECKCRYNNAPAFGRFFQAWLTVLVLPLFVQRIIDSVYGMRMMQIYDENPDRNSVEAPEALVDDEMVGEVASRVQ